MSVDRPTFADLERLMAFGAPGGPPLDEALRLFARLRTTHEERRAIDQLLWSDARSPLPEAMFVAVASALLDRGEEALARCVLARSTSPPALTMRADLAARSGDLPSAVELIERVLFRDIDSPGALERRTRWGGPLGKGHTPPGAVFLPDARDTPFELLQEIGRGSAGAVYEARDRTLGRRVALKMVHHPGRGRAQLLHEARVAIALSGPGIVRIFDIDADRGWLAMEWASLGALGSLLRIRHVGPLLPIARWAVPLATALARVHDAGWVHHDVKPANVVLRAPCTPLIADFGMARRVGEPSPQGSLGYVSPERLAGRSSDPRDDVYAFGRVLGDVLEQVGHGNDPAGTAWRAIARACVGEDALRPTSGADLLVRAAGVASG
ncbi:MAG: serine/threonine protein kinase [Myxococcota bacterium]|nr:serine/threonine protein kinase [Myxococcota bacterium]